MGRFAQDAVLVDPGAGHHAGRAVEGGVQQGLADGLQLLFMRIAWRRLGGLGRGRQHNGAGWHLMGAASAGGHALPPTLGR